MVKSIKRVNIPAVIGKQRITIDTNVVQEDIPLLLSKSSLKKAKSEINFYDNSIQMFGQKHNLIETQSGHYVLPLKEERNVLESINTDTSMKCVLVCEKVMTSKEKTLKLHRQFAHPTLGRMIKLLKNFDSCDKELLNEIKGV